MKELFESIIKVLEEIEKEPGKPGANADALLQSVATFSFFLIVCWLDEIFCVINVLSQYLQGENVTFSQVKTCTTSILVTLDQYRCDDHFDRLWGLALEKQSELNLEPPQLPRRHRVPRRVDDGRTEGEQYESVKVYYRKSYYTMLDILIFELKERFSENQLSILLSLESLLLDSRSYSF